MCWTMWWARGFKSGRLEECSRIQENLRRRFADSDDALPRHSTSRVQMQAHDAYVIVPPATQPLKPIPQHIRARDNPVSSSRALSWKAYTKRPPTLSFSSRETTEHLPCFQH